MSLPWILNLSLTKTLHVRYLRCFVFLKSFEPWNVVTKQKPYFKIYRPGGINFHRDLLSHGLILVGRATFWPMHENLSPQGLSCFPLRKNKSTKIILWKLLFSNILKWQEKWVWARENFIFKGGGRMPKDCIFD